MFFILFHNEVSYFFSLGVRTFCKFLIKVFMVKELKAEEAPDTMRTQNVKDSRVAVLVGEIFF